MMQPRAGRRRRWKLQPYRNNKDPAYLGRSSGAWQFLLLSILNLESNLAIVRGLDISVAKTAIKLSDFHYTA
jgi:hypothetical protein